MRQAPIKAVSGHVSVPIRPLDNLWPDLPTKPPYLYTMSCKHPT